ncbi:TetR/AcrR family transcriptional regulator [Blastococcus sp. TBT05-19]|uniref:ScbR family autoregulator-binding transcription factor n=1 Tax=Blastococcus sp. TBT05-19 TaxID=2250581 RepID=UPI000DE98DA4|nr:ScbR family autoregulator-binding transcription factor [Blastococcus sp. TBT05-19]RBY94525.1 TetR/AcrR family transcriptional regulator [Blastococcus sp. TBT05-19]
MVEPVDTAESGGRRPRGRASDSAATRRLIVEAAATLFSTRGYATASLNDIVAGTGMTKGAVYWHFPSKEDIALEIVRQMYASWPPMLAEVMAAHPDALDALVACTYKAADQFSSDLTTQAAKRLLAELPPEAMAKLPQPYVGWQGALCSLITEGQRRGEINRAVEAEGTAQAIVASFFGMQQVSWELTGRRDLLARLENFWKLVLPQLRPEAAATEG